MSTIIPNNVDVPSNLNGKFFTKALENVIGNDDFEIKEISFSMGSRAGENYCSEIYRAKVLITSNGNLKSFSLIIKNMPSAETNSSLKDFQIYSKEKAMYFDVLPVIEDTIKDLKIAPKCYYTELEPIHTIVFEDLGELGYEVKSRQIGLDAEHAKLVFAKLGKYHAATMVFNKNNPEILKHFQIGFLHKDFDNHTTKFLEDNFSYASRVVPTWPGFEAIGAKLQKIKGEFVKRLTYLAINSRGNINVLNHGDLWVTNMMFKYNEAGQPIDTIFIDYQIALVASPAIDINYFIFSSLQLDVIKDKIDELLKVYYDNLVSTLKSLKVDSIPSFQQIQDEVRLRAYYGMFTTMGFMPVMKMDQKDSADNSIEVFGDTEKGDRKRDIIFKLERVVNIMQYALKYFDRIGTLDELVNVKLDF